MNRITKAVNALDKALAPLGELVKDENFKGELLLAAGAKEKPTTEGKAKTKEKLNFLLRALDALRKKLGLDKSDIPNVSNIAGLAMVLGELFLVYQALHDLLKSCDYFGLEDAGEDDPDRETAINNAVGAVARFLTQTAMHKKYPTIATLGEALGIFSNELNETKRALDLALFPLFKLLSLKTDLDPDFLRPVGDFRADDPLRLAKGIFLLLSIGFFIIEKKVSPIGSFLFNLGHDLPPEKDIFPNAAKISGRVLQMQFVPGEAMSFNDDEPYPDHFREPNTTDSVFSFASIPIFPADADPETEPEGYQYLLGLELNPGEFGSDVGNFSIRFPGNFSGSFIWGHQTKFHAFSSGILGTEPLVEIRWIDKKEEENNENEEKEESDVRSGDIFFTIFPKVKTIEGNDEMDCEFSLELKDFSYSLGGEGRDGFLQKILPENGAAKINASLTIVYSPLLNKWTIEGLDKNDGFLFLFKVGRTLFKTIEIPTLYVGLKPSTDEEKDIRGVALEASAMIKLILGPFQMTVDRLGLLLTLDFPKKSNGNLGMANVDYALKPPSGIGFLVKASVVTGGGFLSLDPENHQYYGAGELTIKLKKIELKLKVVAIILTQLPDGNKGFSFLILASAEFNPAIDTALRFKLKGVGVLVATHRSMNMEEFQNAVRDDRFNSILFPDNPVGNAPTIVKTMNSIFPATQDRYVFAIMARIGWGTTKLVDIKMGLLIEVPPPIKIALAGVIKVTINEAGIQILNLQVNFLVALDFEKNIFSIDAAIYNSKFLIFDIRGDMFIRYRWGQDAIFLVSVGGWHPDFEIPSGLNLPAKPQRLTIPLLEGDNPSLVLSCYVAFTPNTVQAGFKIDFKMKWSKFRLEAGLSVDALFHFEPFYFIVDFEGKLRIFWGDSRLAGVTVKGKFSGTNPWRIRGTATFEIWIWDYDVDFDKSSGEELSTTTQDVDVLPLIEKAIEDRGNWQSTLPAGKSTHIVLRNTDEDLESGTIEETGSQSILADPLSRLEVIQQVTPLGIRIDKLGFQKVKGARKFDLQAQTSANESMEGNDLEDQFAPAMFIEMEDAEKLSRKSFEPMKAGCSFADTETISSGGAQISLCEFDNAFNDPLAPEVKPDAPPVSKANFEIWLGNNSVAKSTEGRKYISLKEIEARKITPKTDPYILADAVTGERIAEVTGQKSMTGAYYELWKLQKINPLRKVNVVRESEMAT